MKPRRLTLPVTDRFIRIPDYEKFEAWFATCWPMPRTRAQRGNWTGKKRVAWAGWRAARNIPYVEPKPSLTMAVLKPLTPEEFIHLSP